MLTEFSAFLFAWIPLGASFDAGSLTISTALPPSSASLSSRASSIAETVAPVKRTEIRIDRAQRPAPTRGMPRPLPRVKITVSNPITPMPAPMTAKGITSIPRNGIQQNRSAKAPIRAEIIPSTRAGTLTPDCLLPGLWTETATAPTGIVTGE